jgi:NTP pyrophosphatase (non-canonical NTP hydrolase)
MNIKQHLFLLLMEECGEVAQAASKCVRFTPEHAPAEMPTNFENLVVEFNDLIAIIELLQEEGLHLERIDHLVNEKKERLRKFMQISKDMGTLCT